MNRLSLIVNNDLKYISNKQEFVKEMVVATIDVIETATVDYVRYFSHVITDLKVS